MSTYNSDDYNLHARLIGGTIILLGIASACFFLGLAYWIRAGLANTDLTSQSKNAYIAEQICFVLSFLIFVDLPALTITRDEIIFEVLEEPAEIERVNLSRPLVPPRYWMNRWILLGRLLLVVAGVLDIVGYAQLPNPADATASSKSSGFRLAGSLIVFMITLILLMFLA
ncbi:MAG: hypothetical protein CYPHOPRED_002343 [Cyphobasidiales sp. Tagirdzhanova-0007]|nr:MAG: hypothetical protein CYPHOPRED_002343 [Cyphobasidiales sp. Tagirdzhanova-0007]